MSAEALSDKQFQPAKLPTHAIFGTVGKVRVKDYAGNGFFNVVDGRDVKRFVHRRNLTFLP